MASFGRYTTQYGHGSRTQRGWGRPELYSIPSSTIAEKKSANISVSLFSGALIGTLRTDIENSVIQDIKFTVDDKGSADFIFTLNKDPSFEILPNSIIKIKIGKSDFNWYCGTIDYPEFAGAKTDKFQYKGFGLRKYLNELEANTVYTAGTDISNIIDDLVQTWMIPYCPISYNASKIDTPSGVVLAFDIELGKYKLADILDNLILMAQTTGYYYVWGVDGDGDFYFKQIDRAVINKTFFIGYNCQDFKPKLNFQDIKNVITVTRKNDVSTGGAGWTVGGVYNNTSSIKKYGRQELIFQIPGYFSDSDCDLIGNSLIENLAEPSYSANAAGIKCWAAEDYLINGMYRFILPKLENITYSENLNDIDDNTQFTIGGTGDLAKFDDTNILLWANSSVKFSFQNAKDQTATLDINANGFIKKIKFYLRSDYYGFKIKFGIGSALWSEHISYGNTPFIDNFYPIEWDVSSLNLRSISKFGIQILDNYAMPVNIWLDKLSVELSGHKTYLIKFQRATYNYMPDKSEIQAQFGGLPPTLMDYVAGLQKASENLIYTSEDV